MRILERRKKSIRNRLIIDIGLILIGVSLVNYILAHMIYSDMLYKSEMDKAEIKADAAMQAAQVLVQGANDVMNNIAGIRCLSDSEKTLEDKIQGLYGYASSFEDIAIIEADNNGKSLNGRSVNGRIFNVVGEQIFERAFNRALNSIEILEYKNSLYLMFMKPIRAEQQSIAIGVIPIKEFLEEILQTSQGRMCVIVNQSGRGFIGEINKQGNMEIRKIKDRIRVKEFLRNDSVYNEGHNIKLKETYLGGEFNFNYELIKGSQWYLGIANGTTNETKDITMFQYAMLNGMLIAILVGIILVYFIANSIATRMQHIARYLGDSIQNEFKASVPLELLDNEDELGIIAKEMKCLEEEVLGMLSNIKESIDYLNDTVVTMQHNECEEESQSKEN